MIYIMAHKAFDAPSLPGYAPLQVGAALNGELGYLRDDAGENISEKNPYFCELTGLYWVWKNRDDAVKGLAHYRRYFTRSSLTSNYAGILPFEEISALLERADMVVPSTKHNHISNLEQMLKSGRVKEKYFHALRESVAHLYPAYLPEFDSFFKRNTGCFLNMLVARREVFDGYCAWLFNILFDVEARIQRDWPEDDPKRLYGYLSERLLNIYIMHNGLRTIGRPVANLGISNYWRWRLLRRNYTNRPRFLVRKLFK